MADGTASGKRTREAERTTAACRAPPHPLSLSRLLPLRTTKAQERDGETQDDREQS